MRAETKNKQIALMLGAFLIGTALRLWFPGDFEYKGDERAIFEVVRSVLQGGAWPSLGMSSGVAINNPGFSYWLFILLGKVFSVSTPADLVRAVQWTNVAAMAGLIAFIFKMVPEEEREIWCWGAALVFVNPFDVLFHRKIWAPSLFPMLSLLTIVGWWGREKFWRACLWGFSLGMLGQLQMGGGFTFAVAYVIGTLFISWRIQGASANTSWRGFALGAAIAMIPLYPWLVYLVGVASRGLPPSYHDFYVQFSDQAHPLSRWIDHAPGQFFWLWLTGCVGLGMDYSLYGGVWEFFKEPLWLAGLFSAFAVILGVVIIVRFFMWIGVARIKEFIGFGIDTKTQRLISIGFFWFGVVFTLSPFFMHRHYLLVAFPFQGIWMASLALAHDPRPHEKIRGRWLLAGLWISLLAISILFLAYIHAHGGAPSGDYGVAFSHQ